jgi:Nucleotidyltransferase domain
MHLTAPSHWSRSIGTGGRDASERVVTIVGMRKHELSAIAHWAEQTPWISEIRLFGSRAKGTARPDSDIDLVQLVKKSPDGGVLLRRG